MHITIQREDFLKPIGIVAGVVERRQTLPILSYVMLQNRGGKLTMTGTDLEVEVVVQIPAPGDEFEITVPARKLFDICRAIPASTQVTLEKQGDKILLKAGKSRFSLLTLPVTDFPAVAATDWKQALTIKQEALKRLVDCTQFCMAQQDVRYYLNGLYLEFRDKQLRAVATDGHRMAVSEIDIENGVEGETQVIVPRKGVQEISRLVSEVDAPVQLQLGANHIRLQIDSLTFTSKLIDGRFPDYTKVIPSALSKTVQLERELFREALARVAILSNEKYRGVRLSLQPGKMSISAHNPEQEEATEELDIEYRGEQIEIGFNVSYLIEAVGAIASEEITLGLNDPNSSCAIYAATETRTKYIVMPMRL